MSNKLSEQEVLQRLGIDNFRQMSKDKIMTFTSSLADMTPEVAKKALEQFPRFAELATDVVVNMKESLYKLMESSSESQSHSYKAYEQILTAQQERLENGKDTLTEEEKDNIIDKMIYVADKMSAKDTEHKQHTTKNYENFLKAALVAVGGALIVLGGKIFKGRNS